MEFIGKNTTFLFFKLTINFFCYTNLVQLVQLKLWSLLVHVQVFIPSPGSEPYLTKNVILIHKKLFSFLGATDTLCTASLFNFSKL